MSQILKKVFPNWKSNGGIFYALGRLTGTPWRDVVDARSLDLDYYGNRSGAKIISSLLENFLNEDGEIEAGDIATMAALLLAKYGLSWSRMWEAVNAEYNPINNYDMTETESTTRTGQSTTSNAVYGFNSTSASPSDTSDINVASDTGGRTLTRSGNIGVTTSAQMIEGEFNIRMRSFFEKVYENIDEVLVVPIFGDCESEAEYSGGSSYVLPIASAERLGGVKIGEGVEIAEDGTISVNVPTPEQTVTSVNGQTGDVVLDYESVGAAGLEEFQQVEEEVDTLQEHVPFRFGIDDDGNYGYYKAGADTVTPFRTGGVEFNVITIDGVLLPKLPAGEYKYAVVRKNTLTGYYNLICGDTPFTYYTSDNSIINEGATCTEYDIPINILPTSDWGNRRELSGAFGAESSRPLVWISFPIPIAFNSYVRVLEGFEYLNTIDYYKREE